MNIPKSEEQNESKDLNLVKQNSNSSHSDVKIKEKESTTKYKLTENEYILFQTAEYEYNDLFPELMKYNKATFFSSLERYILIHLSPKNISFPKGTLDKILKIIEIHYYTKDFVKISNLINNESKLGKYLSFDGSNFLSHCSKTQKAIHNCGNKFLLLDSGHYLFCANCNLIYHYKNVLLLCDFCNKEYYTEIKEINSIQKYCLEKNLKPATWSKYHCNAIMNDTMKCQSCSNILYLNSKKKLVCLNCNTEFNQYDINWKCLICNNEFNSEAKEYDPFIFKVIKITVKKTLFKGVEAKPPYVPCCKINSEQINNYKFFHKKECNGILYEGNMEGKKIVVCSKCHMLNYYFNHFWCCPICKKRFKIEHNLDDINNIKHKSLNEFNHRKKEKNYQNSLMDKYGFQKLKEKEKEELVGAYKTNESKENENDEKFKDKDNNFDDNSNISNNKKYSKSYYVSNKNILRNLNLSNNYILSSNKNKNKFKGREQDNEQNSNINKEYEEETPINNSSTSKKIIKAKEDKNKEEILINNDKSLSFKRISSFYSRGNKNNLLINNSNNKENKKFYGEENSFETSEFNNEKRIKSKLFNNNNYYSNHNYNNYKEYIDEETNNEMNNNINNNLYRNKKSSISSNIRNITSALNFGKSNNQLVSNNIHINFNLNLNINNNNSNNNIKSPNKFRPRINSSKDISSKNKYLKQEELNKLHKKSSIDIVTNSLNINDYNIIKQIGEGTFGKIFEVENNNHQHFALKKLLANSVKEMEMLKSEYEMLLGLEDLNINLIHIYGIENKKLDKTTFVVYVLMELAICDWEKEIFNREKTKRYYTEEELIIILKNLIYTFAELQRNNISHRDIKPQNILLCKDNSLKIADFGEAKEARNRNNIDTIRQTIRGTELYMSPILFDSLKTKKRKGKYILHNSYKSDVFSLGFCILLAATLKVDSLYVIREIKDMIILSNEIHKFLKKRYSENLINVIISMLEIEEKNRFDFIELEKIVRNL